MGVDGICAVGSSCVFVAGDGSSTRVLRLSTDAQRPHRPNLGT